MCSRLPFVLVMNPGLRARDPSNSVDAFCLLRDHWPDLIDGR